MLYVQKCVQLEHRLSAASSNIEKAIAKGKSIEK